MGLDLALGLIVAFAAFRGWLKGFVSQAVRIVGFIACFYLADPLRDQARLYILPKMPAINPGLMDRILWWIAVVVSYVLLVGLFTLVIQLSRNPPPQDSPLSARREDQIGGLLIGLGKGLLVAASLATAAVNYKAVLIQNIPWIERQCRGSYTLAWTAAYRPIPRLWATAPVRNFIDHITRNGLKGPIQPEVEAEKNVAERDPIDGDPAAELPQLFVKPLGDLLPELPPGDPAK
ncbi:MAG: CvpA family protein [Planctomycetaceae bacterium]|nr:CvpA family protein [Planctomycetaceae bacterium]